MVVLVVVYATGWSFLLIVSCPGFHSYQKLFSFCKKKKKRKLLGKDRTLGSSCWTKPLFHTNTSSKHNTRYSSEPVGYFNKCFQ